MLAAVVGRFGLELIPSQFYTRCTLCNGQFEVVSVDELGWKAPRDAPRRVVEEGVDEQGRPLTFFRCIDCAQVYWWGSKSHETAGKFRSPRDLHLFTPAAARACRVHPSLTLPVRCRLMFDRLTRGRDGAVQKDDGSGEEAKDGSDDAGAVGSATEAVVSDAAADASTLSLAASLFSSPPHSHTHALHLRSAYADHHRRVHGLAPPASPSSSRRCEPPCTNYTDKFCDTIDFIFLQGEVEGGAGDGGSLRVRSVVPLQSPEELSTTGPLPNAEWPSDHLSLQVEVEMRWTDDLSVCSSDKVKREEKAADS